MKKLSIVVLSTIAFLFLISFHSAMPDDPEPPVDEEYSIYEQAPPEIEHYWVQKLEVPTDLGYNMIMRIQYVDSTLPDSMKIYYDADDYLIFRDNGVFPDLTANDRIYSVYLEEDIGFFIDKMEAYETALSNQGSFVRFIGHVGTLMTDIPHFDVDAFNLFDEVEIDPLAINAADCATAILKENSLLITDLNVVEDPARTYNPYTGQGTYFGVWTFGYMMANIAYPIKSGMNAQDFLKEWLKNWTADSLYVNGQWVFNTTAGSQPNNRRDGILKYVIYPWLKKCNSGISSGDVQPNTWEDTWDNTDYTDILKYAPFRLTAIVNRIDLRGSSAYSKNFLNAGETRFIFTLIPPVSNGIGVVSGDVPFHDDQDFVNPEYMDWEGMNIIFEYGNPQKDLCQLKAFAQQWLDLSGYLLGDPSYNYALEQITKQVTEANVVPSKPNGSALNRIRTNEKILQLEGDPWVQIDWEMRQFEIDPGTHTLKMQPVTNTPLSTANAAYNLKLLTGGTGNYGYPVYDSSKGVQFKNWVFGPLQFGLKNGAHNFPKEYPSAYGGGAFLAAVARIDAEYVHYWGINFTNSTSNYNNGNYSANAAKYQDMRQQLSLNTCQGCHTGETKTVFTHVMPMKYGEDANYWTTGTPAHKTRAMDTRGYENLIENTVNGSATANHSKPVGTREFVKISAFLTGRNYSGSGTYEDDLYNPTQDPDDNTTQGLFYVFDPANNYQDPTYSPNRVVGYNDLRRRKEDLCKFLNLDCDAQPGGEGMVLSGKVIHIVNTTSHVSFPIGSH